MTLSTAALRTALLAALRADAGLAAAPLAGRIHDAAPRDAAFPHLVLDEVVSRDRSGLEAPLDEHRIVLRVFSRAGGRTEALAIAEAAAAVLAAPLVLDRHHLVLLRRETVETRLLRDRVTAEAVLRLVALTEPV